jgi:hypothetical protein
MIRTPARDWRARFELKTGNFHFSLVGAQPFILPSAPRFLLPSCLRRVIANIERQRKISAEFHRTFVFYSQQGKNIIRSCDGCYFFVYMCVLPIIVLIFGD